MKKFWKKLDKISEWFELALVLIIVIVSLIIILTS